MSSPDSVVSITPLRLDRDSRTLKGAFTYARYARRSSVVEFGRSSLERPPFLVYSAPVRRRPTLRIARFLTVFSERVLDPLLLTEVADLYHLHEFSRFPSVFLRTRISGGAVIYDAHDCYSALLDPGANRRLRLRACVETLLEAWCIRSADAVLTVSDGVAELYRERFGVTPVVIRNCHDERLDRHADPIRNRLGLADDDVLIVTVGNNKRGMEVRVAAEVLAGLPKNAHWAFLGRGYGDEPTGLPPETSERLHFLQDLSPQQVVPAIRTADVAAILYRPLSANLEAALPNGFFQAVAAGLPIVYPRNLRSVATLCDELGIGEAVPHVETAAIGAALTRLLDPDRRRAEAAASRSASRELTWEHEEAKLLTVAHEAVERRRKERRR